MFSLNHVLKFGSTLLIAFVLSGCSSGNGSNNDNHENTAPTNNQVEQNSSGAPINSNETQQTQKIETGAALVISGSNNNFSGQRIAIDNYNTTSINVDGTNVVIGYPGIQSGNWSKITANGRKLETCCGSYSDTRFGIANSLDGNSNSYLFYNGNPTSDMPTSGQASYLGKAIIIADIPTLNGKDSYAANSQFNVDFGNKSFNGSLDINDIRAINIDGYISGNNLSGYASSSINYSMPTSPVEGKFYGEQAKELAGLIQSKDNSWGAVFGAKKQ